MTPKKIHKIVMTGATGFIGSHLCLAFEQHGWEVVSLDRKDLLLEPERLAKIMSGADVAVNLAGAPIVGRWTDEYKKIIYESRVRVTRNLVAGFAKMTTRPRVFISSSAVGYYASQGVHTEDDFAQAEGFLGNLVKDWESEALPAENLGIRTIVFRYGVVLGKNGGALKKMILPFKLGIGGKIGDGLQPFSWIHIKDLVKAYLLVIDSDSYNGIYNLTAPKPTTNNGLTKALGRALSRPTFLQVPNAVLRLRFGEGAKILIEGQTVIPKRLLDSGFEFLFPDIQKAINDCVS